MTIQILKSFGITIHNTDYKLFKYPGIKNIHLITIQLKATGVVVHFFWLQVPLTGNLQFMAFVQTASRVIWQLLKLLKRQVQR